MSGLQFHIPLPGFDSEVVQPTETYQAPIKEGSYFFTPAFTEADLDEDGNPPPPFSVVNGQVFCELVNFSKHKRKVRRVTDQSTGTFKLHKVACAFCRTRKLKCRGFPVCSSCKSRKRGGQIKSFVIFFCEVPHDLLFIVVIPFSMSILPPSTLRSESRPRKGV